MPVKLIIMDVDGTLLNSEGMVTDETRRALHDAKCAGIKLALGTGRAPDEALPLLKQMPDIEYMICCTGAGVFDLRTNEMLYANLMSMADVLEVHRRLEGLSCLFEIMADGHIYTDRRQLENLSGFVESYYEKVILSTRTAVDMAQFLKERTEPIMKLHLFFLAPADCLEARRRTADMDLLIASSVPKNLEFNNPTVDKGVGARALAEKLSIPPEDVMTVGDNENDIGMLQGFGYPVLMGNAVASILKYGRYMTGTCDEDGCAAAVRCAVAGKLESLRKECR